MDKDLEKMPEKTGSGYEVASDVWCVPVVMVNICLVGDPEKPSDWVLIDAALWNSAGRILDLAEERFGPDNHPKGIILTHGHFDHVGAVKELCEHWDVLVYAHEAEIPYLTGQDDYPPADPTVDTGLMAQLSPLYPRKAIDLGDRVKPLPKDGSVPLLPGWRWLHTPGHTPGHVSFFRDEDQVLIAGDAFITVDQESALAVLTQEEEVHGPPKYFTTDWDLARKSVRKLEDLNPEVVAPGHGVPIMGKELEHGLGMLARNFDEIAVPEHGRYV